LKVSIGGHWEGTKLRTKLCKSYFVTFVVNPQSTKCSKYLH